MENEKLIERYKEQMMSAYQKRNKTSDKKSGEEDLREKINKILEEYNDVSNQNDYLTDDKTEKQIEDSLLKDEIFKSPCIRNSKNVNSSLPANTEYAEKRETRHPLVDEGILRVEIYAASQAYPVKGAMLRVKNIKGDELIKIEITDESGRAPNILLKTPDRILSQNAENPFPYSNYLVDIRAKGYQSKDDMPVQMFGGIVSILSVNMIPDFNL